MPRSSAGKSGPELVTVEPATTAVVRGVVPVTELPGFFDRSFGALAQTLAAQQIAITGPAFALYRGPLAETADLEVGFTTATAVHADGDVTPGSLPGGTVARLIHAGGFDALSESWQRLRAWIDAAGLTPAQPIWEVYLTEPTPDMDPADLRTELNWPVDESGVRA
jgi:effector-binding domain-containing protein